MKRKIMGLLLFSLSLLPGAAGALPVLDVSQGSARATVSGDALTITTGVASRSWKWTGQGLATVSLKDLRNGREWVNTAPAAADWLADGVAGDSAARMLSLTAVSSTDSDFTSEHLQVVAEIAYPETQTSVRWEIWAYPGAEGLRTQLWVKRDGAKAGALSDAGAGLPASRADFLPVTVASPVRAVGYYNDTQRRHTENTHLVRDEMLPGGRINWASLVFLEDAGGGMVVVKESHKCVNQSGVDTGAFLIGTNGVAVTGWGLPPSALTADRYRWCWATWTVLYSTPDADARELALKRFDRTRYPMRAELDLYTKANTWGSGGLPGVESVNMAKESEVLPEIDSVADLGLDTLQIDDGWQIGRMQGKTQKDQEWQVRPDWYPQGWSNVVARAKERDIDLGIWMAARAPLADLKSNYDQAHFKTWKLDFANLAQYNAVESYLVKARNFISYTDHKVRVNWDVTENAPRWGYFWARECGNIWLANRKPTMPVTTIAVPHLQLREARELSRYLNPSKFELAVQNYAKVDPEKSDAHLYSDTYSVAVALPGIPVFFQTTRLLTPSQRTEIKDFLDVYKNVRRQLFDAYVFEIGDEPDNRSWSGFQWVTPGSNGGHLLVFRERLNEQAGRAIRLRFLKPGTKLHLTDLRSHTTSTATLDAQDALPLSVGKPGDILFLSYRFER